MSERSLLGNVLGGLSRIKGMVALLNQRPVPPGVHHDVQHPIP
jgi:hypothetical protein